MPRRGNSITTSSTSSTSSPAKVQFVKGVGPRLGAIFGNRGIETVRDLLYFFPRTYEDRSRFTQVADLKEAGPANLSLTIRSQRVIPIRGGRKRILDVRAEDASGTIGLKWFYFHAGLEKRLTPGRQILVSGKVQFYLNQPQMVHPDITWDQGAALTEESAGPNTGRIVPIYTELEGVPTKRLRQILWNAIEKFSGALKEDLPERFLAKHNLPRLGPAVTAVHFPPSDYRVEELAQVRTPAQARLIYEEFFKFEYLVLRKRAKARRRSAKIYAGLPPELNLPFSLTNDQEKVLLAISEDLRAGQPMNRLVQGDVGSGKTVVALQTAAQILAAGDQAALMAPTEILAEQHYRNALKFLGPDYRVVLLMGKTTTAERRKILARLAAGEPILVIGTHALIEPDVMFKQLTFVMIDEQHRFGVEQRMRLRKKGEKGDQVAHSLILTATPIPRTLALTAYGDLSVSEIKEMPPGRQPVQTQVVASDHRRRAYQAITAQLMAGRQAYFIYPLVNDSEAEGFTSIKSAVTETERLKKAFPKFQVGLLHGQLKPAEKSRIMQDFQQGKLHVLVSTTVVEVGVDNPNATVMVIEHAERFGLSQLHQLRGRVGRGEHQSYCYLFAHGNVGEISATRLEVLEQTQDGFKIAEADLEIRGPGEFLGTRQSGSLPFKLGNLVRDRDWLMRAREDAESILDTDPDLQGLENARLRAYFQREGLLQSERLATS